MRSLRRRLGWTQQELAARAGVSQGTISRAERGHVAPMTVERLRNVFLALDARLQLAPSWRGAALDRLLDADHAAISGAVFDTLGRALWTPHLEVTYSEFGERGSIDILATRRVWQAALVVEVKSDLPSSEQVGRKVDEKARLAPGIVFEREGWRPAVVGRIVVLPDEMRLRRAVKRTDVTLGRMFPARAHEIRRWLRDPSGPLAGLWFLSNIPGLTDGGNHRGRQRVRSSSASPRGAQGGRNSRRTAVRAVGPGNDERESREESGEE